MRKSKNTKKSFGSETHLHMLDATWNVAPGVNPKEGVYSKFKWSMHVSLPFPFPARKCVDHQAAIEDSDYRFGIHNHYDRLIVSRHNADSPPWPAVHLIDKRKPKPQFDQDVTVTREHLKSVATFLQLRDFQTASDAFGSTEKRVKACLKYLSTYLAACQRNAPYLMSWLVYPISHYEAGTIYHDVRGFAVEKGQWQMIGTGVSLKPAKHLEQPAFVMEPPARLDIASPFDTANELLAESLMSTVRGLPRLGVLNAYTAIESLANAMFLKLKTDLLVEKNVPEEMASRLVNEERERHRTQPDFLFHSGIKDACGRSLREEKIDLYEQLSQLQRTRHQVAHTGYKPSEEEGRMAHRTCCETVIWFAELAGVTLQPLLPEDASVGGLQFKIGDAFAATPEQVSYMQNLLNSNTGKGKRS